jgi:transcriptional regulator with XRE-family HTH domain
MVTWQKVPSRMVWNRVKTIRKMKGLTQPEVAVGAGVSIGSLWAIEAGFDSRTTSEIKEKIAKFFVCEVGDLFPVMMVGSITKAEYEEKKLKLKKSPPVKE